MNQNLAAAILRKGKALAPDRFPAVPADREAARLLLAAWVEALGTVNLPEAVWSDAVTLWATQLVGDRMVTPRDLVQAAFLVRDRWENEPSKRAVLDEHRLRRLNDNYARMGLEAVDMSALDRDAQNGQQAVHGTTRRQDGAPVRLDQINFTRRSAR